MTASIRGLFFASPLLVALLLISACEPRRHSNESDMTVMKVPNETSTTRCFGRYTVDLPSKFAMYTEGGQVIDGVELDVVPMDSIQFDANIEGRLRELQSTFMSGPERYPLLRSTSQLPAPAKGVVFDRAENPNSGGRLNRQLEVFGWKDGYRISAKIEAIDTSFPEDANEPALQALKPTLQANLARVLNVFSRTSGRGDSLPSGQGVCILNGFVSGPAKDEEGVTLLYRLKDAADVYFRFNTENSYTREDTLVERSKKIEPVFAGNQGRTLRRAKRTVKGISDGEEYLYTILGEPDSEHKQIMKYKFIFEANSTIGSAATPLILVNFENGEILSQPNQSEGAPSLAPMARATLSEAEAIALWDVVIPTIRPRPGAF